MAGKPGRSGGKRTPGPNAKPPGRKRQQVVKYNGEDAFVIRSGDALALFDAYGPHLATATVKDDMVTLTNEAGQTLTLVRSE